VTRALEYMASDL